MHLRATRADGGALGTWVDERRDSSTGPGALSRKKPQPFAVSAPHRVSASVSRITPSAWPVVLSARSVGGSREAVQELRQGEAVGRLESGAERMYRASPIRRPARRRQAEPRDWNPP
jgi:hypothetical protein